MPVGWEWGEEWQISLDFSSIITADYGLTSFTDQVYETQVIEPGEKLENLSKLFVNPAP